jgi:hypothetical protein
MKIRSTMNPLYWKREHLFAWILFCLVGNLIGLLCAWYDSPFRQVCRGTISGDFANCGQVFSLWISHPSQYWLMAILGAAILGTAFYALRLMKT